MNVSAISRPSDMTSLFLNETKLRDRSPDTVSNVSNASSLTLSQLTKLV